MRSNVCRIENGSRDLEAILRESEKVAVYNELTHKQSLQLRLICEELDGMLPNVVDNFSGDFWIDFEDGLCKVNVSFDFERFTPEKKEDLVAIAKNKKNAAVTGIVGRIRSALENIFLDGEAFEGAEISSESRYFLRNHCDPSLYTGIWTLGCYRSTVKKDDKSEAWDELEKSVIASVADDVIVGVKGRKADLIIVKNFA